MPFKKGKVAVFRPLCHRCEHRAKFNEVGYAPRYECGQITEAVVSCYMYRPVQPLELIKDPGEKRSLLAGWMFAGRAHAVRLAPLVPFGISRGTKLIMYWGPHRSVINHTS